MVPMTADESLRLLIEGGRCPVCRWTLSASPEQGCVLGNCAYRTDSSGVNRALSLNRRTYDLVDCLLQLSRTNPFVKAHLQAFRANPTADLMVTLIELVVSLTGQNDRLTAAALKHAEAAQPLWVLEMPAPTPERKAELEQALKFAKGGSWLSIPIEANTTALSASLAGVAEEAEREEADTPTAAGGDVPAPQKPPIGVSPSWLWREQHPTATRGQIVSRFFDVRAAVARYEAAGLVPSPEWLAEMEWLAARDPGGDNGAVIDLTEADTPAVVGG